LIVTNFAFDAIFGMNGIVRKVKEMISGQDLHVNFLDLADTGQFEIQHRPV
jgi:hypothetical protein